MWSNIVSNNYYNSCSNPEDVVRAKVPFTACLERFAHAHEVPDFYSTAVGGKSTARKLDCDYCTVHVRDFS